jgi:hypothetical protein
MLSRVGDGPLEFLAFKSPTLVDRAPESGGAKTYHGSGGIVPLRAV